MDATQLIDDSILESEEEEGEENGINKTDKRGQPLAKLRVLTNEHIPEAELPLYQGENVIGRDPGSCSVPILARSVSKQHAVISISVFHGYRRHGNVETEALLWDLGSMNGTRKGRSKLSPHVRYSLADGEGVVLADIPCQYISVDKITGPGDMKNPINRESGRGIRTEPDRGKTQLRKSSSPVVQVLGIKTDMTDSTRLAESRGVNGKKEDPSSVELGAQVHIPPKSKFLSLEQTPKQSAEQTLAPESESDEEREGRRNKNLLFVSASVSHWSSPTCSSFLSPTSIVIPESEDESSNTPRSSAKDRPRKPGNPVSFSEDESDVDIPRQKPRKRRARMMVDDSEDEERKEGQEAAGAKEPGKITEGKEVSVDVAEQVGEVGGDGEVMLPAMLSENIPAFNMDCDTDVEGNEEMGLDEPVATTPCDPGLVLTDSHTDTEEQGSSKLMPAAAQRERKPADPYSLDSDTDVEDDVDVSDRAFKAMSSTSDPVQKPDNSAPMVQSSEFQLDSDTDKEETEPPSAAATDSRRAPESESIQTKAVPQDILLDSDTEEEDNTFAPAGSKAAELLSPLSALGAAAALEIRSDSDTEDEAPETTAPTPPGVTASNGTVLASPETTTTSAVPVTAPGSCQESGSDTDVEEQGSGHEAELVPESDLSEPGALRVDSDTDVEEDSPDQARMQAAGPGSQQKCSTPLASSVQEEMETQAFFSPLDPFRRPAAPSALRPTVTADSSNSESDSLEENDFVVAETQPFVLEGQGQRRHRDVDPILEATQPYHLQPPPGSFQLGLSDISTLQPEAEDLATETTNLFSFPDEELEATQAYGAVAMVDKKPARDWTTESTQVFSCPDGDSDLEGTQAYGSGEGSKEPGHRPRSAVFGRDGQVDVALEATQAYGEKPCSDDEEEQETQPLVFPTTSVSTPGTLPRSACREEEGLVGVKPSSPVRRGNSQWEDEQSTQKEKVLTDKYLSTAETLEQEEETKTASWSQQQPIEERETQAVSYQQPPVEEQETQAVSYQQQPIEEQETQAVSYQQQPIEEQETQAVSYQQPLEEQETQAVSYQQQPIEEHETLAVSYQQQPIEKQETQAVSYQQQPIEEQETQAVSSYLSTAETQPSHDEEDKEEEDSKGKRPPKKEPEAAARTCCVQGGGGAKVEGQEPKRLTRGKAVFSLRGRRREVLLEENETDQEEEVVQRGRRGRGRKKEIREEEKKRLEREKREEKEREREETERLEREREETERLEREREETERLEREREETERLEREREETERLEREREETERLEREREETERLEREREETERLEREREETERLEREREETERLEREREETERLEREREEAERLEREREKTERLKREREETKRLEQEREETERLEREREETERLEREREETERLEREREETERLEREREETERLEREREETERLEREREETERLEREREETERLEREREETERLEREREETERLEREREETERLEREREETERKEKEERLDREVKDRDLKVKVEREQKEREVKEASEALKTEHNPEREEQVEANTNKQNEPKTYRRGCRATTRRTSTVPSRTKPVPDQDVPSGESEPVLASRTRARSNSSNSVSSERSASSVGEGQGNRGRGRGRGARKTITAELGSVPPALSSTRRRTVAGQVAAPSADVEGVAQQLPSEEVGVRRTRSNSASSLKSDVSSGSVASETSQGRGRGAGRGGRGRKTNADLGPKAAGGRRCKQADQLPHPERDQEAAATRGQKRAAESSNPEPVVDEETVTAQITEQCPLARGKGTGRARGGLIHSLPGCSAPTPVEKAPTPAEKAPTPVEKAPTPVEKAPTPAEKAPTPAEKAPTPAEKAPTPAEKAPTPAEKAPTLVEIAPTPAEKAPTPGGRLARKRELEDSSEFKVPQVHTKVQRGARHGAAEETSEEKPASTAMRRSRASSSQGRRSAGEDRSVEEAGPGQGKVSDRRSVGQTDKEGNMEESSPSSTQQEEASEVTLTPTSKGRRKRSSPADSSPAAKTPRSSSLTALSSPGSRSRAASQTCKVLFTGLVDEEGEKVVRRLGGSLAKGVTDMTHLVTDRVRRTVKFLCAVARGVPIVTTKWLEKSGEAGSFLSTDHFLVKDSEQENKFSFCLEASLRSARTQPLLQGYQVHVTQSVLPEPAQMKDIITCSGARFLPKMPSSVKAQTVVISCGDDWSLCVPALSATLPVLSAEFLLTGVLQQRVDLPTHALSAPETSTQPGGKGQGRGRKKS